MELFKKQEKGKDILSDNHVIITLKSNGKYDVEIDSNCIKVTPKGFKNAVNKGLAGTKTYPFDNLTAVQYKEPGFTTGYLQFILMGSQETKRGVSGAVHDENSILFNKKELPLVLEIKEYVEYRINSKTSTKTTSISAADEILKFKELLDQGILTQEEFDAKKKQLLGL